ncbi:MAG: zinc ribbon domain-containing protein [Candidatus Omnitrophica bacterium]|nr:zinc ribbon domain-containing protein [Candidatus Omnitrophota bacterium]
MPTYDYECSTCGHTFEEFQSMVEKRLKKCPKCGKLSLDRLLGTGSGVIFKGSGFYQTDYKNKDSSKKEASKKKSDSHSCSEGCPHKACPANPSKK